MSTFIVLNLHHMTDSMALEPESGKQKIRIQKYNRPTPKTGGSRKGKQYVFSLRLKHDHQRKIAVQISLGKFIP